MEKSTKENESFDWVAAKNYLHMCIAEYSMIGASGMMALHLSLFPLKRRFDNGERTQELFDEIMDVII